MADEAEERQLLKDLVEGAEAIGRLAEDESTFRAAVDAFRAQDAESWAELAERLQLVERCEVICDWLCSKECFLLCLEFCGPPRLEEKPPDIREFAQVVARVTADEELVELLANAVEERDPDSFAELVKGQELERFCHLLCHWACTVRCRLIGEVVCPPQLLSRPRLIAELQTAGEGIRSLVENEEAFAAALDAVRARNCELLRNAIAQAELEPFCRLICEWFCSWHCVLVCLPLCRSFPFERPEKPVQEMWEFAREIGKLAGNPDVLQRLSEALGRDDSEASEALVRELGLERFCLQLCHWLCFVRCRIFCRCVCLPPIPKPLFTHVGQYRVNPIYGEFSPAGTTTSGGYAFTDTIPLRGNLPLLTGPNAIEYRFRYAKYPGPGAVNDIVGVMIAPTVIGVLRYWYWNAGWQDDGVAFYYVNNPGATVSIPQIGPDLVVSLNKDVKPGGWIEAPTENEFFPAGRGAFIHWGGLADLDTTKLTEESFDLTAAAPPLPLKAGDTVPAAQRSEAPTFRLLFEARKVGPGPVVSANNLDKIALSNTHYKYTRHAEWDGGVVSTRAVTSLDIAELIANGCDPLTDDVHALFTAYHPYLAAVSVYFVGPGPLPAPLAPAIAGGEAISEAGGHDFDISALSPCAYVLWLQTTVNLTRGYGLIGDANEWDYIAFCKEGATP